MTNNDEKKFQKKIELFKLKLSKSFGLTIKKPFPAKLGTVDENGNKIVKVPADKADEPNEYYFSEIGSTSYRGKAQLRANAIPSNFVRYGTPIRIIKDVLTGQYEITGVDVKFFEQYYKDSPIVEKTLYNYKNISPGLIRATVPVSMQAVVLEAAYNISAQWKYIKGKFTVDWAQAPYSDNVPVTANTQRFVMIGMDFVNESLIFSYGEEIDSEFTFYDVLELDDNSYTYLPVPTDATIFRCGYIRLYNGQTTITDEADIFPMQDFLAKGGGNNEIVTAGGHIVVVDGEVVTVNG